MEGLPASMLWEFVVDVLLPVGNDSTHIHSHVERPHSTHVPPKIEAFSQRAQLFGFEDTVNHQRQEFQHASRNQNTSC